MRSLSTADNSDVAHAMVVSVLRATALGRGGVDGHSFHKPREIYSVQYSSTANKQS